MDIDPISQVMSTVNALAAGFFERLPQIIAAFVVLLLTWGIAKIAETLVRKVLQKTKTRLALIRLATNLIGIAAWIFGIAIAVTLVFPSITPAKLIAGLGLTSVAIGFAFKDVFENFLAGMIILARKKMRIGDIIECNDISGRVEDIAVRETHVRELDGELLIVPNAYLFKNPLKIQTDKDLKRQSLTVGVDYDADLEQTRSVLSEALSACDSVEQNETRDVDCVSFGGSSIDFKLMWWTDSEPKSQRKSYDQVAFSVKAALDKAGIEIPFPQTTLSFRDDARAFLAHPSKD